MKKISITFLVISVSISISASDKNLFREKQVRFIKELYQSGRYFDSIAETGKLQFTEKKPELEYFIYLNYFSAGQYNTVIYNYTPDFSSDELQFRSLLLLSQSFFKNGMYMESYEILKNFEYGKLTGRDIFPMFLRRVEPLILSGETVIIDKEISKSEIFLGDDYNFTQLRAELQQYNKEGLKSPGYAAFMSAIVPGLGQCYAGYPGEGFISLLSVAASAAGGIYMKDRGRRGISYTMFFFSGLFYGGNIYSAHNAAEFRNSELLRTRHSSVVSKYGSYNSGDYIDLESVFR
jgi:TM2 domain-containing membrane protein YozV